VGLNLKYLQIFTIWKWEIWAQEIKEFGEILSGLFLGLWNIKPIIFRSFLKI